MKFQYFIDNPSLKENRFREYPKDFHFITRTRYAIKYKKLCYIFQPQTPSIHLVSLFRRHKPPVVFFSSLE